jgi:hypothetical protein
MDRIATVVMVLGLVAFCVGNLWLLIAAFRENLWWGLACFFLPIVQLFFLFAHWPEAKRPFLLELMAFVMMFVGFVVTYQTLPR